MRRTARTTARLVVAGVALAALVAAGAPAASLAAAAPAPAGPGTAPAPRASGSSDPALPAAIAGWVTAGGEADLAALGVDFTALERAAAAARLPEMAAACARLRADVEAAQRHAAIPDAAAQWAWATTLALYDLAAGDCITGATRADPSLLDRASDEIIQGSDALGRMTDRLNQIG